MVWLQFSLCALYAPGGHIYCDFACTKPSHHIQPKHLYPYCFVCVFLSEEKCSKKTKEMPNVRFALPSKNDPRRTQPNTRQQYLPENVITAQPSSNGLTKRLMKWRKQKDYQLIDSSTRERHYRNGFVSLFFYCL